MQNLHLSLSFSHKQIKLYVRLLFCFYFLLLLLLAAVSTRVRGPSSPGLCFFFHNVHALIINVPETARPPPAYQHPTCYRYAFFKCFFFTLYMFVYRNFNPNVAEKLCRFILRKKSANYSTLQKIR